MTKDGDPGQELAGVAGDGAVLIPLIPGLEMLSNGGDGTDCIIKREYDDELDVGRQNDDVDVTQMLSVVNQDGNLIRTNHAMLQSILSTPISGSQGFTSADGIQVISLPSSATGDVVNLGGDASHLVRVMPGGEELGAKYIGLIALPNLGLVTQPKAELNGLSTLEMVQTGGQTELSHAQASENMAAILMPPPSSIPELPPGCPAWAARLKKCEKIGDSFRGYVEEESDLDLILTLHKQQTNSFWGTRQSPSPAKASTRLMWKSQYVPFDGIPFINAGSRAVVMECQYGPRRKGTLGKRAAPGSNTGLEFKQTCPARIYIKKVRKFPSYAVDLTLDKKTIRMEMDKAFHELREHGLDWGQERFYVQLPTEKAHDYHEEGKPDISGLVSAPAVQEERLQPCHSLTESPESTRIHPAVLDKIRQLVSTGETKLYAIRKQLRKFVVSELSHCSGQVPERHDLTLFPTVNDLKNHIHQALKDIESGLLPLTQHNPVVNLTMVNGGQDVAVGDSQLTSSIKTEFPSLWSPGEEGPESPLPESVTVTLTQNPGEDGHHIISRIETHLSDGSTQVSTSLNPETAQLLSRLHPGLFPAGGLFQMEGCQSSSSDLDHSDSSPPHLDASISDSVHVMGGLAEITDSLPDMMDSDPSDPPESMSLHLDTPHSMMDSPGLSEPHSHTPCVQSMMDSPGLSESHTPHHTMLDSAHTPCVSLMDSPGLSTSTSSLLSPSVLCGVDPNTISAMVSSGAAQLSLVPGHPDTLALRLVSEEACREVMRQAGRDKLGDSEVELHLTTDQELGMARLENRVSDL